MVRGALQLPAPQGMWSRSCLELLSPLNGKEKNPRNPSLIVRQCKKNIFIYAFFFFCF